MAGTMANRCHGDRTRWCQGATAIVLPLENVAFLRRATARRSLAKPDGGSGPAAGSPSQVAGCRWYTLEMKHLKCQARMLTHLLQEGSSRRTVTVLPSERWRVAQRVLRRSHRVSDYGGHQCVVYPPHCRRRQEPLRRLHQRQRAQNRGRDPSPPGSPGGRACAQAMLDHDTRRSVAPDPGGPISATPPAFRHVHEPRGRRSRRRRLCGGQLALPDRSPPGFARPSRRELPWIARCRALIW